MSARWARFGAVGIGLLVTAPALAEVPGGEVVLIKAIAKDDAFWESRKALIGLMCAVEQEGLHDQDKKGKWQGGSMTCVDGQNYYFYKVAVERGEFGVTYQDVTGKPYGQAEVPVPMGIPGDDIWAPGETFRITGLSPEDSYYESGIPVIGLTCVVTGETPLTRRPDGFYGGPAKCDGTDYYFFKIGVGAPDAPVAAPTPAPTAAPAPAPAASPFPAGKMVKIVDIDPADQLHAQKSALVGRTCSVVEAPLVDTGGGFYAGRLFCDDGKAWQVFKAKVAAP